MGTYMFGDGATNPHYISERSKGPIPLFEGMTVKEVVMMLLCLGGADALLLGIFVLMIELHS